MPVSVCRRIRRALFPRLPALRRASVDALPLPENSHCSDFIETVDNGNTQNAWGGAACALHPRLSLSPARARENFSGTERANARLGENRASERAALQGRPAPPRAQT